MEIINQFNPADRVEVSSFKEALDRTLCNLTGRNYAPEGFRRATKNEIERFVPTSNFATELPENAGTNPQYRYDKGTVNNKTAYRCVKTGHHGQETDIIVRIKEITPVLVVPLYEGRRDDGSISTWHRKPFYYDDSEDPKWEDLNYKIQMDYEIWLEKFNLAPMTATFTVIE